jgi:hypothetical protein
MKDLKYFGKVDDGKLTIFQRNDMVSGLQNLGSGFVEIIIRLAGKRSSPQNRYYWGAMLPIVKDGLKGVGIEMSKEQTHEMLKYKFIKREFITSDGDILQSIGSTTELSTKEFNEYIESIQIWSAEYLNVNIPDPNEQTEITI